MGVELGAVAVDWPVLLAKIEEKPGRLRRASFLHKACDRQEPWLEDLSEQIDPTDASMIVTAQAYDRIRPLVPPAPREAFDRFAGAFFWMWTEESPYDQPPVRDLGPRSDAQSFFSSFSPASVANYLESWNELDLNLLREPFELGLGHRAYHASKARNATIFEGAFHPYFAQWGSLLEKAAANGRGLIISFV